MNTKVPEISMAGAWMMRTMMKWEHRQWRIRCHESIAFLHTCKMQQAT